MASVAERRRWQGGAPEETPAGARVRVAEGNPIKPWSGPCRYRGRNTPLAADDQSSL